MKKIILKINSIFNILKSGGILLLTFTLILGIIYPLCVTFLGQFIFPFQANGSLLKKDNVIIGSELIGQNFKSNKYFWSRSSSTIPIPYNALNSRASNFGPTNPFYIKALHNRITELTIHKDNADHLIPMNLITSSASGLDPHISVEAAYYQIQRIAKARKVNEDLVKKIVESVILPRQWGFLGEPRVNVLKLNLALDERV